MRCLRFFVIALVAPWAAAATFTWNGAAGDAAYSNPSNWEGGAVPPNDGSAVVVFGNAGAGPVTLSQSLNVAQLRFDAGSAYRFDATSGVTLTLQNGVVSTTGTGPVSFGSEIALHLARSQTFDLDGGAVRIDGTIYGTGSLQKAGDGDLKLFGLNLWTGGLTHASGTLHVGPAVNLGLGTLRLTGGTLAFATPDLAWVLNPVVVDGPVRITGTATTEAVFTGPVTLNQSSRIEANAVGSVVFTGDIAEAGASRRLTVTGLSTVFLNGASRYTGGTTVENGALVFGSSRAVPASGRISASPLGYVGAGFESELQRNLVDRLDPATFLGILGLDTNALASGTNRVTENLDVSQLTQLTSVGSRTSAILAGELRVAQGSDYVFGGGGGTLTVEGNLTARGQDLEVRSPFGQPLTLVLQGNNTYQGATNVLYSVLVLDRRNTLPSHSQLNLTGPAYVGYTERANLTPAAFLGRVNRIASPDAILGLDSVNRAAPRTVSDAIDLSVGGSRTDPYYLGTSSKVVLTGSITPTVGDALYLTAVKGGHLIVRSRLSNAIPGVVVGQFNSFDPQGGVVELSGNNNYTGGTQVRGGTLRVSSDAALGTGGVAVSSRATLEVAPNIDFSNQLSLAYGARLSGSGTFLTPGGIIVSGGAQLAPGGVLQVGSMRFNSGLTLGGGGVLDFDIQSLTSGGWDQILLPTSSPGAIPAVLSLTASSADPFILRLYSLTPGGEAGLLSGFDTSLTYSWTFATADTFAGFDAAAFSFDTSHFLNGTDGGAFFVSRSGNHLMINFTPVPEPGTYVLFGLGAFLVAVWEYRRRRRG